MQQMRDLVLEGAQGQEIEILRSLCVGKTALTNDMRVRLQAKGWIDTFGDANLVTLAGRTLADRH